MLALAIVKQGEQDVPGLTDTVHPKRLGPKRATKIRKFFGLTKDDDVCLIPLPYSIIACLGLVATLAVRVECERDPSLF